MWTCGRGEYGLCGNGGTEDQLTPAPLEAFEDQIIVDVQVSWYTAPTLVKGATRGHRNIPMRYQVFSKKLAHVRFLLRMIDVPLMCSSQALKG